MIYKQKDEQPMQTLLTINELDKCTEFPIVITKDEKMPYMCVYEVEEFNHDTLSVVISNEDGKVLVEGEMVVEG